jgi:hypothetical protein
VDEVGEGCGKRQNGDLHHVVLAGVSVDERKCLGVDEILGVVRDDDVEGRGVVLFKKQHALVDPVEAVGLGGGSVVRAYRKMDMREAGFQVANRIQRGIVIRVGADKKMIIAVVYGGGVMLHHAGDHGVLMPQRDEDGDGLFTPAIRYGQGRNGGEAPPYQGPEPDCVQSQVVQAADQNEQRQRQQRAGHKSVAMARAKSNKRPQ